MLQLALTAFSTECQAMFRVFSFGLTFLIFVLGAGSTHAERLNRAGSAAKYTMGPQDKLKVRVYDWRVGTYDTHEWPALTGEFTVDAAGAVSFPIVGEVPAEGKTPAELAVSISEKLRATVGLAQTPFASVEVIQYRPFYILGAVAKPGEYPYRPGLTVLQALGVGGGLERASDTNLLGLEREALSGRGEIQVLEAERRQGMMRQARITAELDGKSTIQWPAEIVEQSSDLIIGRAMQEEQALLTSHRSSFDAQSGSLRQTKQLIAEEIVSLGSKRSILQRQEALSATELALVSNLVARGLAGTPRQVALQQNQAQLESTRVDLELAALRTQQDGVRADRDHIDFEAKTRSQLLADEADLRARLASLNERIASLHNLVDQAEVRAPFLLSRANQKRFITTFSLARLVDGETVYTDVSESFMIHPGDTLRVEQRLDDAGGYLSSSR